MEMKLGPFSLTAVTKRAARFFYEAQRRRVWRTALAYAAVVFVLLQLGEIVFPAFDAPESALRILVIASFLGFPLALCLAWAFDITSGGIRRTESKDGAVVGFQPPGSLLPRLALVAVTLAVVGGIGWWSVEDTLRAEVVDGDATPGDSGAAPGMATPAGLMEEEALQIRSLAVLPLDDYSQEEGGEYFTAGLHEELVSQLSQVGAARVLSRTSAVQYDRTGKTMPVIASELGVEGVVEGSVFRDGNRVRITVQLIHGATDQHLWANSYEGTLEDAIALQRTVAQAIAKEIKAEIAPSGEEKVSPTRVAAKPVAQDEYMKGWYNLSKATPEGIDEAIRHYEAAVESDSGFAPGFAGLAAARLLQRIHGAGDSITVRVDDPTITTPLERAFSIDRDSREARQVVMAMQGSLGSSPELRMPDGVQILMDSTYLLEAEFALRETEFGRQLRTVLSSGPDGAGNLGVTVHHVTGDKLSADRLSGNGPSRDESPSSVEAARDLMEADRASEALAELQHALAKKERELVTLWTDPAWDPVRTDPRFRALLSEIRHLRREEGMLLPRFP